ncbi:MAG: anthranilate phosphoribosyltransferase, partial [Candidatus Caldatribacteriaceae bacterium]
MMGREILERLVNGERLDEGEAYLMMRGVMEGNFSLVQLGAMLAVLQMRGEEGEELSGFVRAVREKAVPFSVSSQVPVADNCGTGGDNAGTFNISTAAALLSVSVGIKMVKHGNRSVTSRSGSADFLEHLGIPVEASPEAMRFLFEKTGFAFLYAPRYHPAMRAVQGVRKELGIRTVFNLLGPLVNPCAVDYKLVGVYDPRLLEPVGMVLGTLRVKRGLVVFGEPGMDEVSLAGESQMALWEEGAMRFFTFHPREVGLPQCSLADLQGGTPEENVHIFLDILRGKERGALRKAVLLNAAFLLWLSERTFSVAEALGLLEAAIESGRA